MDIRDFESGVPRDYFWFRAKTGLIEVLLQMVGETSLGRILDIGAGTGDDMEAIGRFGEVHVIEPDKRALEMIPDGSTADKRSGDICTLPYEKESFDVAVAFDVLEHVEDDLKAVSEIRRILRPGGHFVFSVPAGQWLFSSHDRALGHYRRYEKPGLRALLSGFEVLELGYWMCSLFPLLAMQRLLRKDKPRASVQYPRLPRFLNDLLYRVLKVENSAILRGLRLPFGSSLWCICRTDGAGLS